MKAAMSDTTDLHGAGECDFDTCAECIADASCCGEVAPLHVSRITGDVTRHCTICGTYFI